MEQSQVGMSQNDSKLVTSRNDTSVVCRTGWAANEANAALKIEFKDKKKHQYLANSHSISNLQ